MSEDNIEIYTDGASRGNPGNAAWAFVIVRDGTVVKQDSVFMGTYTNNVAEYNAVINALKCAIDIGIRHATLYSDSELVVRQVTGQYSVRKEHLKPLWKNVHNLIKEFDSLSFHSVPRENKYIGIADALCNKILDEHAAKK